MGSGTDTATGSYSSPAEKEEEAMEAQMKQEEAQEKAKNKLLMENQITAMRRFRGGWTGSSGGTDTTLGG